MSATSRCRSWNATVSSASSGGCPSTSARSSSPTSTSAAPISEVAEILGIPVGTAKSRLNRGLLALRDALAAEPGTTGSRRPGAHAMNGDVRIEPLLERLLAETATSRAPDRLRADIASTTSRQRQRPPWLASLKEPPMRYRSAARRRLADAPRGGRAAAWPLPPGRPRRRRHRRALRCCRARTRAGSAERAHRVRLGRRHLGHRPRRHRPAAADDRPVVGQQPDLVAPGRSASPTGRNGRPPRRSCSWSWTPTAHTHRRPMICGRIDSA